MKKLRYYFNMVEVTLALAVVGLGIAGIMSLFPVGLQATRDAVAENYSSIAGEQFLTYISLIAQKDWNVISSLKEKSSTSGDFPNTVGTENATKIDLANYNSSAEVEMDNIYNNSSSLDGLYLLKYKTGDFVDFEASVMVWKSQLKTQTYDSTGGWSEGVNLPYTQGAGLNIEISWPKSKEYEKREKRYYYMEVFKKD